jgi:hypothetical protein
MKQYVPTLEQFIFEGRTRPKQKSWSYDDFVILYYIFKHDLTNILDASDDMKGLTKEEAFYMKNLGADATTIPRWMAAVKIASQQPEKLKQVVAKYKNTDKSEFFNDVIEILEKITEKQKKKNFKIANKYVEANVAWNKEEQEKKEADRQEKIEKDVKNAAKSRIHPETPYSVGDIITHKKLGYGEVLDISTNNVMKIKFNKYKTIKMEYDEKFFIDDKTK